MKPPADPAALVRPELRRLDAYRLDRSPCRHKLDQNESPYEPPRRLRRQVAERLLAAGWSRYPDFHADELRRDLGAFHDWPADGILVGNGSNELLDLCLSALVQPGGEVLGSEPSFALYRMMVLKAGGVPRFLPAAPADAADAAGAAGVAGLASAAAAAGATSVAGLASAAAPTGAGPRLPLAALLAEVARQPRRPLVLCSPNNPTGEALAPAAVAALLERLEGPLLLDNAYGEFCRHDYRPLLDRHPRLILLRTFSKAWALAGLRLGYLLADPRLVAELLKVKLPYNVGHAGVLAGRAALAAAPAARRRIAAIRARREQWRQMLAAAGLGLEVMPSEANFLLVRCPSPAAARWLRDGLAARGIRVRDVGSYPGLAGCLRISVGSGAALRDTRRVLAELAAGARGEAGEVGEVGEPSEPGREVAGAVRNGRRAGLVPDGRRAGTAGDAAAAAAMAPESARLAVRTGRESIGASAAPAVTPAAVLGSGRVGDAAGGAAGDGAAGEIEGDLPGAGGRRGEVARATAETRVRLALTLDGGRRRIDVPNGFFGHMLTALATHGGLGLEVTAAGDLQVDLHHTVEDVGIAFGEALDAALGERRGVTRFGTAFAPLDEALARAVVDLSGRGFFAWAAPPEVAASWVTAEFPLTLVADFFQAVADRGRLTLHLEILAARNGHHAAEAAFKAVALALRQAAAPRGGEARRDAEVPSTKGTLTA